MTKSDNAGILSRFKKKATKSQEVGGRKGLMEELFNDFNRSRAQVYKMNFVRGIFFGLGSVLGGTIVIALLVWSLSLVANIFPPLENFFTTISREIEQPTE